MVRLNVKRGSVCSGSIELPVVRVIGFTTGTRCEAVVFVRWPSDTVCKGLLRLVSEAF